MRIYSDLFPYNLSLYLYNSQMKAIILNKNISIFAENICIFHIHVTNVLHILIYTHMFSYYKHALKKKRCHKIILITKYLVCYFRIMRLHTWQNAGTMQLSNTNFNELSFDNSLKFVCSFKYESYKNVHYVDV